MSDDKTNPEEMLLALKGRKPKTGSNVLSFRHQNSDLNKNYLFTTDILSASWLPRKLKDKEQTRFVRRYGGLTLITSSGYYPDNSPIGLPSGVVARKLFIGLIDRAFRGGSPVVEFQSVYQLLKEAGFSTCSHRTKTFHKQALRLATCRIEIYYQPKNEPNKILRFQGSIFDAVEMNQMLEKGQMTLFANKVIFADSFFEKVVMRSGFGYLRDYVKQAKTAYEVDVLLWLVRRVAFTNYPVTVEWRHLKEQFANSARVQNYNFQQNFERAFTRVCELVGIDATINTRGVLIQPPHPEIKKKLFRYSPKMVEISEFERTKQ
jgi:hypothetical protein